jgi:hypothetical protein
VVSARWTDQPQSWAVVPAGVLTLAATGLLFFAPGDDTLDALGWAWPIAVLALVVWMVISVRRQLHGGTRLFILYPVCAIMTLAAVGGGYQTIGAALDRRAYPHLARLGVMRLFYLSDVGGLPPQARAEGRAIHSTAGDNRGSRDEFAAIPAALQQARALESLGDKPLAVVTAASEAQDGWLPLQDEMAALSTRSAHLVLPDATHASLIDDERDAAVASQAILNVVEMVRGTGAR